MAEEAERARIAGASLKWVSGVFGFGRHIDWLPSCTALNFLHRAADRSPWAVADHFGLDFRGFVSGIVHVHTYGWRVSTLHLAA